MHSRLMLVSNTYDGTEEAVVTSLDGGVGGISVFE